MTKTIKKAVIPIAGRGTRLLPATKTVPKEFLTIIDKPVVHYIVEEAVNSGIQEILIIDSKDEDWAKHYFSRDKNLEAFLKKNNKTEFLEKIQNLHRWCDFHYTYQKKPDGSGDALLYAENFVQDKPFAFFYVDDIIHNHKKTPPLQQVIDAYEQHGQPDSSFCGLIKVNKEDVEKYGIIDGAEVSKGIWNITNIIEKPHPDVAPSTLASVGRFILNKDIFPLIRASEKFKNEIYLATALNALSKTGNLFGKALQGEWYDCGSKQGLWHANMKIGLTDPTIQSYSKNITF